MRFRITVRGEGVELRGFIDRDNPYQVMRLFADDIEDEGALVIASPAEPDYDPFKEERDRELHHFETEQENERLTHELAQANSNHADLVRKYRQREEFIRTLREDLQERDKQFASPPPGWYSLGTHVDQPDVPLEFWGTSDTGDPIWERPKNG